LPSNPFDCALPPPTLAAGFCSPPELLCSWPQCCMLPRCYAATLLLLSLYVCSNGESERRRLDTLSSGNTQGGRILLTTPQSSESKRRRLRGVQNSTRKATSWFRTLCLKAGHTTTCTSQRALSHCTRMYQRRLYSESRTAKEKVIGGRGNALHSVAYCESRTKNTYSGDVEVLCREQQTRERSIS
jgi:hypothetical protein